MTPLVGRRYALAAVLVFACCGGARGASGRRVALYYGRSCGSCAALVSSFAEAGVAVEQYSVEQPEHLRRLVSLELRQPAARRDALPVLVFGETLVYGKPAIRRALPQAVAWVRAGGARPVAADACDAPTADTVLCERFRQLDWLAVAAAGLLDGVNPCAFATVLFLLGALTAARATGGQALQVGVLFVAGIFVSYVACGLGFLHGLETVGRVAWLRRGVGWLLPLVLLLGSLLFLVDALRLWRGGSTLLTLPRWLRRRSRVLVARGLHLRSWGPGAFGLGMLVALLELACTGQIYLPTILYVVAVPALRGRAVTLLLLYNAMFVLPLLGIVVLYWRGLGVAALRQALQRQNAWTRLGGAVVLLTMFIVLRST